MIIIMNITCKVSYESRAVYIYIHPVLHFSDFSVELKNINNCIHVHIFTTSYVFTVPPAEGINMWVLLTSFLLHMVLMCIKFHEDMTIFS